jgi:nicotinate phosphoribosyltransferase
VDASGDEIPVIKLSAGKITLPGRKQVWRQRNGNSFLRDLIGLADEELAGEPLIEPVMRDGIPLHQAPALLDIQRKAAEQLAATPESVRALERPSPYEVDISTRLRQLVDSLRER